MNAKRTDSNQAEIVKALRRIGATVTSIHTIGKGAPDLLVGFRGASYCLEVKTEKGELTPAEREWLAEWQGHAAIVRNVREAYEAIGAIEVAA